MLSLLEISDRSESWRIQSRNEEKSFNHHVPTIA
jgi:hypothetical protein